MIAIIDYGVGNLFSLASSFAAIGHEAIVTSRPEDLLRAERLILPGVGAFADAREKLRSSGLEEVLREQVAKGKPIMGICLGMQMLFDRSYEYGVHDGLSLIGGEVRPISEVIPQDLKIPHIGWNRLDFGGKSSPLFKYINEGDYVYFVHSFAAMDCEDVIATSEYGAPLTAAVARGNVYGCQFHPEKSGNVGLNILRAFAEI